MGENRGNSGRNRPNGHKKSRVPCSREDEQKNSATEIGGKFYRR